MIVAFGIQCAFMEVIDVLWRPTSFKAVNVLSHNIAKIISSVAYCMSHKGAILRHLTIDQIQSELDITMHLLLTPSDPLAEHSTVPTPMADYTSGISLSHAQTISRAPMASSRLS